MKSAFEIPSPGDNPPPGKERKEVPVNPPPKEIPIKDPKEIPEHPDEFPKEEPPEKPSNDPDPIPEKQ